MDKTWLLKLSTYGKKWGLLLCVVGIFLLATVPSLFSDQHILNNLEPYPDGLLYALSARNFAMGQGLQLRHHSYLIPVWVPPLYPLTLSVGYLFSAQVSNFYLINLALSIVSIFLLWQIAAHTTKHWLTPAIAIVVYLSHGYVLWLPMLAMTENLSITLTLFCIFCLTHKKLSTDWILGTLLGVGGLILTRYSSIPIALFISFALLARVWQTTTWRNRVVVVGVFILNIVLLAGYLMSTGSSLFDVGLRFITQLLAGTSFYSFSFIASNTVSYLTMLLGGETIFLWQRYALTSLPIAITGIVGLAARLRSKSAWPAYLLLGVLIFQLPLLLIFYSVDARYVVVTLLIWSLGSAWLFDSLYGSFQGFNPRAVMLFLISLILTWHTVTQASFYREIVSSNILHRSTAWQYEATKIFNQFFDSKDHAQIITALPPFFVSAYQTSEYRTLPLSTSQEFLQKGEKVWGNDLDYQNLLHTYTERLKTGQSLFISNAYITHQAKVIEDFELYKTQFELKLVQSGCQEACNIYQLHLKPSL